MEAGSRALPNPGDQERDTGAGGDAAAPRISKGTRGFVGSVLALGGGAVIAQGLGLLASPIVSRLFAPDALGTAEVWAAIVGVASLAGCLRYEAALMLPKDDEDAANLFGLCCVLVVATTLLVTLVTAISGPTVLQALDASDARPYTWLIPIGFFLLAAGLPLRYWNTRHRQFERLARVRIGQATVTTLAVLGSGFLGFVTGGHLILARICSQSVTPAALGLRFRRGDLRFVLAHCSVRGMWRGAKRYRRFPAFSVWVELLNGASRELPTLVLAGFFGATSAGLYALARRLIFLPSTLIGGATSQVLFQRTAELRASDQNLRLLVESVVKRLALVGLLPLVIVATAGPELFRVAFGDRWTQAGLYASVLSPWVFLAFVCSPLTGLFHVLERQRLALFANAALLAARMAALLFGALVLRNVLWALALFSGVGCIYNACMLAFFLGAVGGEPRRTARQLVANSLYVIPSTAVILAAKWWLPPSDFVVLLAVALSVVPYGTLVLRSDPQLRKILVDVARRIRRRT